MPPLFLETLTFRFDITVSKVDSASRFPKGYPRTDCHSNKDEGER